MRYLFCTLLLFGFLLPNAAFAQTAAEVQSQIDSHNAQIKALEAEIAQYQQQLDTLGTTKNTLQSAISSLTISQKQLTAQIQVTQNKIAVANSQIVQLTSSIGAKEEVIAANQIAIGKALRELSEDDGRPLVTVLLSSKTLGDAWQSTEVAVEFNRALSDDIERLKTIKTQLAINRDAVAAAKATLVSLANDLASQKKSVDANKAAQVTLLAQTKNQESNYQKLLTQKKASQKAFESELASLEDQLDLIVHPSSLPKVGSGVLGWPPSLSFMTNCAARTKVFGNAFCITQYFGNTSFSTANPQIYNGHGHNAIDIGMPIGTQIIAARDGVVLGTGNTDLIKGCYSFGKWVMVKHTDGLNTLYAHLSVIEVVQGQTVTKGQELGLSGMTGYATGPHLHFGVYATEGTRIQTLAAFRGGGGTACSNATMPVATLTAYLNPLSYL